MPRSSRFGLADFLFVAIVAAAMSSMDSVLLVAASTGYKNLATGASWWPVGPAEASAVDAVDGGCFGGGGCRACIEPPGTFSR